ncbi:MAG: hypothetical protein MUC36_25515 [Planctomycetes bacterium]|jgi:hypothetical protein|nr:hypothetical protein [Planctomycetota bacterium]
MLRSTLLVASFSLSTAALLAQSAPQLVGLTRNLADLRRHSIAACAPVANCSPIGFPGSAALPATAGGAAWDAIHSGTWISNGQLLACVDDTCGYLCPPVAIPGIGGAVFVVGMEVVTSTQQLLVLDSADNLHVLDLACPPVQTSVCPVAFVNPFVSGGLAADDLAGLVFFTRFDPATGLNQIAFAAAANPCTPIGLLIVPPCGPVGAFTGLAVDSVAQVLYGTDGQRTVSMSYLVTPIGTVVLTGVNCCPVLAGLDPLTGLAMRPGRATATGVACNAGICPPCPMVQSTAGDSVLGNADFALRLNGAPAGSIAWCMIGAGPCAAGGPVVPPLCGPAYTLPLLGILGANLTIGAGCAASTSFSLPLPANASLGGLVLSSQCFVWCPVGPGGSSMSPCLSFELQGL